MAGKLWQQVWRWSKYDLTKINRCRIFWIFVKYSEKLADRQGINIIIKESVLQCPEYKYALGKSFHR